jgi:uncharacterized protein (TIGR02271 family)
MQHTLVAVFDNRGDAQKAMDDLLAAGFPGQEMRLTEGDPTATTSTPASASSTTEAAHDEGLGASIRNFFSDIFGTDDSERAQMYSAAVTRGHHVLTVIVADQPEVERAADIVERHCPVDIDERAAEWSGSAASAGAMRMRAQQHSQPMSQQSVQGSQAPLQGSQQRAEGSTAIPVIQEELKIGKRDVQRGGVRIYQHMVATPVHESVSLREEHVNVERHKVDQPISPAEVAAFKDQSIEMREMAEEAVVEKTARVVEEVVVGKQVSQREQQIDDTVRHTEVDIEQLGTAAGSEDDSDYRTHWNSNYAAAGGSYDEYAPAYRYGASMAGGEKYRGRAWNDVEPSLKSDWETRYPGSAWEKFKAAVRHGWEKITS